jgi:hypothetical protein
MPVELHFAVNKANFNHAVLSRLGTYKLHLWFVSGLTLMLPTRMTVRGSINEQSTQTERREKLVHFHAFPSRSRYPSFKPIL